MSVPVPDLAYVFDSYAIIVLFDFNAVDPSAQSGTIHVESLIEFAPNDLIIA